MAEESKSTTTKEINIDKSILTKFIKNRGITITNEDDESFYTGTIMIRDQKTTILKLGGGFFNINIKFAEPTKRQIQMNKGAVPLIEFGPAEKKVEETTTTTSNNSNSNTSTSEDAASKLMAQDEDMDEEEAKDKTTSSITETNLYAEKAKEIKIYMDVILYSMKDNQIIYTKEPLKLTSEEKDNIYIDLYAVCITENLVSLTYTISFDPIDLTKKEEEEKEKKKKERQEKNKAKEQSDGEPEDDD